MMAPCCSIPALLAAPGAGRDPQSGSLYAARETEAQRAGGASEGLGDSSTVIVSQFVL